METQRYGRYTLIEQIGQGGMSVVYQARDPVLDRFVARRERSVHAQRGARGVFGDRSEYAGAERY